MPHIQSRHWKLILIFSLLVLGPKMTTSTPVSAIYLRGIVLQTLVRDAGNETVSKLIGSLGSQALPVPTKYDRNSRAHRDGNLRLKTYGSGFNSVNEILISFDGACINVACLPGLILMSSLVDRWLCGKLESLSEISDTD